MLRATGRLSGALFLTYMLLGEILKWFLSNRVGVGDIFFEQVVRSVGAVQQSRRVVKCSA